MLLFSPPLTNSLSPLTNSLSPLSNVLLFDVDIYFAPLIDFDRGLQTEGIIFFILSQYFENIIVVDLQLIKLRNVVHADQVCWYLEYEPIMAKPLVFREHISHFIFFVLTCFDIIKFQCVLYNLTCVYRVQTAFKQII